MLQLMTGQGFTLDMYRSLTVSGSEIAYSEAEDLIDVLIADIKSFINRIETAGGGDIMLSYPMINSYIRTLVENGLKQSGVSLTAEEEFINEGEPVAFGFAITINGSFTPSLSPKRMNKILTSSDGFDVNFNLFEN